MKVALSFPGCHRSGGVERIVFECARYLSTRGHAVEVFASKWEVDRSANISYVHVPALGRPRFLAGAYYRRRCTRILAKLNHDVLGTHGCVCPSGGVHWVQSVQRAWLEQCSRHRRPFSKRWLLQKCNPLHPVLLRMEEEHFGRRQYAKVIATTPRVRDDLQRFYGVPADDILIIPNGFSPEEFNPERRAERRRVARAKLNLNDGDCAVLFAANELERKGYDTLLRAIKILDRPEIKVIVVGRPPTSEVRDRAARVGVGDAVLACGPTSDIAGFHAAADLFALPTQYEAFCLAILEALGSGLPVITSNVPGAGDAIQDGVNGWTISSPTNAEELAGTMRRLLDPDLRQRMSVAAPTTVACYQWPRVLAAYEDVLLQYAHKKMPASSAVAHLRVPEPVSQP